MRITAPLLSRSEGIERSADAERPVNDERNIESAAAGHAPAEPAPAGTAPDAASGVPPEEGRVAGDSPQQFETTDSITEKARFESKACSSRLLAVANAPKAVARDAAGATAAPAAAAKAKWPAVRPLRLDFAALKASAQERLERLRLVSHGSTHFHGSRAGSLIAFHSSTDAQIRGSLVPMGTLLERQAPVYSGERGNAFHERGFNRRHLSVVDEARFEGAVDYATDSSFASRSPIKSQPSGMAEYTALDATRNRMREVSKARLDALDPDSTIAHFVKDNFPVVYGLKPDLEKVVGISSDIPGEAGVRSGADHSEIAVVFVPDDRVAAVKAYLQHSGYPKPVEPLSSIA